MYYIYFKNFDRIVHTENGIVKLKANCCCSYVIMQDSFWVYSETDLSE